MNDFSWLQQSVKPLDENARGAAQSRQQQLTKPPGALGRLEDLAIQLAAMQGREQPQVESVFIGVFAGDHGIAQEGVSAFPQAVTAEMVKNFARGGAAISVLAKQLGATLEVVNLGTAFDTGELPGVHYEEFQLEGYGPGGCALLIDITSDNRNRTVAEIRNIFTKQGCSMAEAGAVSWQFHKKGLLVVEKGKVDEDKLMTLVLDAGAEDMKTDEKTYEVTTGTHEFEAVKKALADAKIETALAEVTFIPENSIKLDAKNAEQVLKLMDTLEDQDDVQKVHANFDIPEEIMEKVAAAG